MAAIFGVNHIWKAVVYIVKHTHTHSDQMISKEVVDVVDWSAHMKSTCSSTGVCQGKAEWFLVFVKAVIRAEPIL